MKTIKVNEETATRLEAIRKAGYDTDLELSEMVRQFCLDTGIEDYQE